MPEVIKTVIYTIDELSEAAKETARAWYRQCGMHDQWYDFVYEDFSEICRILGITLGTASAKLVGGGTRDFPQIFFRGFWSQGDGASFAGHYRHARGATTGIRRHAPKDDTLHAIADSLQAVQRRNFFQLRCEIRQCGNYCHEYTMHIAVERDSPTGQDMTDDAEDAVIEALRDLARWLYRQLQQEYEYQTSDTAVDESLATNRFTFTEHGHRFG